MTPRVPSPPSPNPDWLINEIWDRITKPPPDCDDQEQFEDDSADGGD
jgi:hypothetical protein